MEIGDRVKYKTNGGWYNSGIIISKYENSSMSCPSCLIEVDTLGYKPSENDLIVLPYYRRIPQNVLIAEYEEESKDGNIKLVSYEKCKDCEHYGVWSERCWNVYECPKEVKIDAENESLSEADKEKILRRLSYIKRRCLYGFVDYYARKSIREAADEIERIIEHKEQRSRQDS
jgi:hypothetical protein